MTQALPRTISIAAYDAWRADPARWLGVAADIARSHGLPCTDPQPFAAGSNLVVALGDGIILKIFPPMLRHQFVSERAALSHLEGRLGIAVPRIVAEGERDGWPYLAMTRLAGTMASAVWPELPEDRKERILAEIGAVIAEVHRLPVGALAQLEPQWQPFIVAQIAGCRARHARQNVPAKFLDGLEDYLRDAHIPLDGPKVILTGEYTPENLLLREDAGGWSLAGLIDFGDVMTGWRDYDLLGPGTLLVAGVPGRLRSFLRGYGYSPGEWNSSLTRRLMALLLLHRYSNLDFLIGVADWRDRAADLHALERLVWPIGTPA